MPEDDGKVLHAVFTMNCLPAGGGPEVRGPERWDHAERAVTAFADAVREAGFRAALFVTPEALHRFAGTVRDLSEAGVEAGVLCHPQLSEYQACLGSYSFDRQREIVALARKTWENHLGESPTTFRPGYFSANDYTYHVLCMEGFRQGSCSLPGRMDNDQCSLWFPSYPFPHHTDPLNRTQAGTMEFYEVPVTSDFEAATHISYETYTPPHMRIEQPDLHEYAEDLIARHIKRMLEDQTRVKAITLVTSNVADWGGAQDPHVEKLHNLCSTLRQAAERGGLELRGATLSDLHEKADEIHRRLRELEEEG